MDSVINSEREIKDKRKNTDSETRENLTETGEPRGARRLEDTSQKKTETKEASGATEKTGRSKKKKEKQSIQKRRRMGAKNVRGKILSISFAEQDMYFLLPHQEHSNAAGALMVPLYFFRFLSLHECTLLDLLGQL